MKRFEIDLKSWQGRGLDLLIIAGEHSGDQHAATLVKEIKRTHPQVNIAAFGGEALRASGADLILDMTKFAVVGFYEVWINFFFFLRLIHAISDWIKIHQPKVICLVDYPGFNLHLARKLFEDKILQKSGGKIPLLYYISPQVWAWKVGRVKKIAKLVDKIATILPFEKKFFEKTSLDVKFVGHPFVEDSYTSSVSYRQDGPILLLPGSRSNIVKSVFPMLLKTFCEISKCDTTRMAAVVYPSEEILSLLRKILNKRFPELLNRISFISDSMDIGSSAAIMSAGTMSLKCCLAGIPGAIVYKTNPINYAIGRILVKVKYLGLANIVLQKCVWREFLQGRLRPKSVAKYILHCLGNDKMQQTFLEASQKLRKMLSTNKDITAAEWLISAIEGHNVE